MASLEFKGSPDLGVWEMVFWVEWTLGKTSLQEHNFIVTSIIYNRKVTWAWFSVVHSTSNYIDYSCMLYNNHRKMRPEENIA